MPPPKKSSTTTVRTQTSGTRRITMGLVAAHHIDAVRRLGHADVAGASAAPLDIGSRARRCREGWSDAFFNLIADAYRWIAAGDAEKLNPKPLPTFADALRSARLIEAMLQSHTRGGLWTHPEKSSPIPTRRKRHA